MQNLMGRRNKKKMKKGGKNRPLWTEHKIPVMHRQWQPPRFGDLRTRTAQSHCPSPSWQENNHQNPTFSLLFIFFPSFHQGKKKLHPFPLCWMSYQAPMATIRPGMLQCKNPSPEPYTRCNSEYFMAMLLSISNNYILPHLS